VFIEGKFSIRAGDVMPENFILGLKAWRAIGASLTTGKDVRYN